MTILQERDDARRRLRLRVHQQTRLQLRDALVELLPGQQVVIFGSLTKPGTFHDRSDVDIALETKPPELDQLQLMAELSERLSRPVDLVLLDESRFRDKILKEGERWTL